MLAALWLGAGWWIVAVHPLSGPVLFTITETNGVHVGDLPAVAVGVAASMALRRRLTAVAARPGTPG